MRHRRRRRRRSCATASARCKAPNAARARAAFRFLTLARALRSCSAAGGSRRRRGAVEAEVPLPVWDELEPPATEPESFEPQEALDIMDETADEFGDEESEGAAPTTESAGGQRERRRARRKSEDRVAVAVAADAVGAAKMLLRRKLATAREPGDAPADDEAGASEGIGVRGRWTRRRNPPKKIGPRASGRSDAAAAVVVADVAAIRFGTSRPRGKKAPVEDDEVDFGGESRRRPPSMPRPRTSTMRRDEHDEGDEHDFDGDEDDEDGDESPRIGFRNIPTWQDAIGVMIAKNLESRSRNPGGSRGPGGRGGRGERRWTRARPPARSTVIHVVPSSTHRPAA